MPVVRLDNPPPAPPDVQAQLGSMLQERFAQAPQAAQGPPGELRSIAEANPRGALMVKVNAIERVMREIAREHEAMAPFIERSLNILKQGMQEVLSQGNLQSTAEPQPGTTAEAGVTPGLRRPLEGHSDSGFVG
jgi:hypothetical protein